jgi:hypothetical protein
MIWIILMVVWFMLMGALGDPPDPPDPPDSPEPLGVYTKS